MVRLSRIGAASAALMLLATQAAADEASAGYIAATCNTCHYAGAPGTAIPALAGRDAAELIAALQAYRSGARQDSIMHAVATSLSDAETSEVAAYLAHQERAP